MTKLSRKENRGFITRNTHKDYKILKRKTKSQFINWENKWKNM